MSYNVALFTRAWIEIEYTASTLGIATVALFTRAWIEMSDTPQGSLSDVSRPLYEGVD